MPNIIWSKGKLQVPIHELMATVTLFPFVTQALFVYYILWLLCSSMYNVYWNRRSRFPNPCGTGVQATHSIINSTSKWRRDADCSTQSNDMRNNRCTLTLCKLYELTFEKETQESIRHYFCSCRLFFSCLLVATKCLMTIWVFISVNKGIHYLCCEAWIQIIHLWKQRKKQIRVYSSQLKMATWMRM